MKINRCRWETSIPHPRFLLARAGPGPDARDLANFTMTGIEKRLTGIYNTAGEYVSWGDFLNACKVASGSDATYTWIDDPQFLQGNVDMRSRSFGTIPMAIPAEFAHVATINNDKALDAGLVYRSKLNTARDVLAWEQARKQLFLPY